MNRPRIVITTILITVLVSACGDDSGSSPTTGSAAGAQDGNTVSVFYTGTLDDGSQFDSNVGGSPLVFVLGDGRLIPGFEDAVRGAEVGETITVRIEAADAYGTWSEDNILELDAAGAPEGLEVGQTVTLEGGIPVVILEITAETITVDANHPLAGEALTFEIEIVSVS